MIELPVLERVSALPERPPASGGELVRQLVAEQQSLSAVEAFSRWHDGDRLNPSPNPSLQGRGIVDPSPGPSLRGRGIAEHSAVPARYSALLPAAAPGAGEQYAFEVDLDRCSGCKACVTACHTLNGLDESETWRDVGLLVGGSRGAPVVQHVTAACHHCLEPACMIACPVNAYEKDPATGIVRHLDDQCFGCQYCTLACPYDVPKYNAALGIVRKCDMCSSRLTAGEAPACVQACPHEAIAIRVVNCESVIEDAEAAVFLPAAPDPQITFPTTTYKTAKAFPRNLLPADYFRVNPQHAHWPLVVMLTLTQLSVGAFIVGLVAERLATGADAWALRPLHAVTSLGFGLLALGASLFHLGRPRYAYRAVLGLRHSWLSREIVAFGAFAATATAYAAALLAMHLLPGTAVAMGAAALAPALGLAVAATGVVGVACSAMIYVATGRECWSFTRTAVRFALTASLLGVAAAWLTVLVATVASPSTELTTVVRRDGPAMCRALAALAVAKLAWDGAILRHLALGRMTALRRSALLLVGELSNLTVARFALGLLGGVVMPLMLLEQLPSAAPETIAQFTATTAVMFTACVAGELVERTLFFRACAAPRMPGGIR